MTARPGGAGPSIPFLMVAKKHPLWRKRLTASFLVRPVGAIGIFVTDPRQRNTFTDPVLTGKLLLGTFFDFYRVQKKCITHAQINKSIIDYINNNSI